MNVEALTSGLSGFSRSAITTSGAEKIKENREAADKKQSAADATVQNEKANAVQPEELLQSIKALTDNGVYSVRFELNKDTKEMVINLVEQESGKVIRQIPPDEVLGVQKVLSDLRGNLLQTTS